jgi:hypothetical protein
VVPPSTGGDKGTGREDVHMQNSSIVVGEIIIHEGGMIDVALTSRYGGAIERNNLCGLLSGCL